MNLRKKAKKYKKLYEASQKLAMPYNFDTVNYNTIMIKESFPKELLLNGVLNDEVLTEKIGIKLAKEIMPHVTLRSDFEPKNNLCTVYATIRVIKY